MWLYSQSTGLLWDARRLIIACGYSGCGDGKNRSAREAEPFVGPIPRGMWIIGDPYTSEKVGPFALPLTPTGHRALGRTDFLIHGDSLHSPGTASCGCIILSRSIRETIHISNDKILEVIE